MTARKYARTDAHARAAAETIVVGDTVVDLAILGRTGCAVRGEVIKLHTIDGVPHALVRGGPPDQRWLACHPVTRFRRVGGGL